MEHAPVLVALSALTAFIALLALWATLTRKGRTEDQARAYLAGFTYVISDDPDSAIAELSRAAQLNTQTLETYFALGALFRRKGELDRAIRLHRNILLRPGLSRDIKWRAQLALALDYKRSGLKDKAAEAFEQLLAEEPDHRDALVGYRQVLEEQEKWDQAIELQARLMRLDSKGEEVMAHLLSELAQRLCSQSPGEAEALAERAVRIHPASAHAQIALGQVRLALGRVGAAIPALTRAIELEPELAPGGVRLLGQALEDPKRAERFLLEQIAARGESSGPLELALALHHKERGEIELAIHGLKRLVERKPRLWEARKELGALLLSKGRSDELVADYAEILGTLGQPATGFACAACRQKLPEHAFRCAACESWGTVHREEAPRSRQALRI